MAFAKADVFKTKSQIIFICLAKKQKRWEMLRIAFVRVKLCILYSHVSKFAEISHCHILLTSWYSSLYYDKKAKETKEDDQKVDITGATTTESSDSGPLPVPEVGIS